MNFNVYDRRKKSNTIGVRSRPRGSQADFIVLIAFLKFAYSSSFQGKPILEIVLTAY